MRVQSGRALSGSGVKRGIRSGMRNEKGVASVSMFRYEPQAYTGNCTWMGRIWEFMNHKGDNK